MIRPIGLRVHQGVGRIGLLRFRGDALAMGPPFVVGGAWKGPAPNRTPQCGKSSPPYLPRCGGREWRDQMSATGRCGRPFPLHHRVGSGRGETERSGVSAFMPIATRPRPPVGPLRLGRPSSPGGSLPTPPTQARDGSGARRKTNHNSRCSEAPAWRNGVDQ